MAERFLLLQISDPHVGAEWSDGDPLARLRQAVAAIRALPASPDAILLSGDVTDHAEPAEYEAAREEGHLHAAMGSVLGGRPVIVAPSVLAQATPEFELDARPRFAPHPPYAPGFAVHLLHGGEIASRIVTYTG